MAAPVVDSARRRALAARIVAMAEADAIRPVRPATEPRADSNVVALPLGKPRSGRLPTGAQQSSSRGWLAQAASALAASLVLGILLGASPPVSNLLSAFDGGDRDGAEQVVLAVQNGDLAAALDEESL